MTPYIGLDAVDAVLRFVAGIGAKSGIIFDYLFRSALDETAASPEAKRSVAYVRSKGEPFVFGLDPREVDSFLEARGLSLEEHLLPDELNRRLGSPASPTLRSADFYALAIARAR